MTMNPCFTSANLREAARVYFCAAALSFLLVTSASAQDVTAPVPLLMSDPAGEAFVAKMLSQMSLEEKIGQMSQIPLNQPPPAPAEELARRGKVGSFLFVTDAAQIDKLQHIAVEQSRLHIPLLFGFDVIHGFRTIYPVPIALAASWDPQVEERAQSMAAREASAVGVRWTFAPMVDIARDPRWGRMMEGAGEDPFLGSKMAAAQVRGFQGPSLGSPDHILACVKHFAGYGAAVGGRDYEESNISDEQLWNVYFPPFHAALAAGAGSLMSAYMDLNGVPATGNRFLLHDILRDDWHFQGFVVSDWESVLNLTTHGFSTNPADAAARAVNAGVDMEMTSTTFNDTLAHSIDNGAVSLATIDQAVRDILMTKWRLGLFRAPYAEPGKAASELVNAEQRQAAREVATRTAVLLRNEGQLLPLKGANVHIALIGPLADSKSDIMGSWSLAGHPADSITVLEGMRKRFGADAVTYTTGVEIEREQPSIFDGQFRSPKPKMTTDAERAAEFQHAIDLIRNSDVAVLALGELQSMSGERASRQSLDLPGRQEELLEAAVATGKPIVLLLLNARPLNILWAAEHVPAILEAWYPGTEGGDAIAGLLTGDANPGGKLPFTWPRTIGQIPVFYAHDLSQIPNDPDTRYWDGSSAPLYPFGYGLSYTTFAESNLRVSSSSVAAGGKLTVSVDLANTGTHDGDEVVQLYTHERAASMSRPIRELKGFERVSLKAGERKTVTLAVDTEDLGFWSSLTHHWSIEPGMFDVWVGNDSTAKQHATFELTH
jgi:beta-glucosidase